MIWTVGAYEFDKKSATYNDFCQQPPKLIFHTEILGGHMKKSCS